jgi:predicted nucleic acid-binding protein
MAGEPPLLTHAGPDASLVVKWHTPDESGWEHALVFYQSLEAGAVHVAAPEHLKVEAIRLLQLGVRDKRYSPDEGLRRTAAFLNLPITYTANDLLFEEAFRLASHYMIALYDSLYLALAQALEVPLVTADRRFANLARQRQIAEVAWFEDVTPSPAAGA